MSQRSKSIKPRISLIDFAEIQLQLSFKQAFWGFISLASILIAGTVYFTKHELDHSALDKLAAVPEQLKNIESALIASQNRAKLKSGLVGFAPAEDVFSSIPDWAQGVSLSFVTSEQLKDLPSLTPAMLAEIEISGVSMYSAVIKDDATFFQSFVDDDTPDDGSNQATGIQVTKTIPIVHLNRATLKVLKNQPASVLEKYGVIKPNAWTPISAALSSRKSGWITADPVFRTEDKHLHFGDWLKIE